MLFPSLLLIATAALTAAPQAAVEREAWTMGTRVEIRAHSSDEAAAVEASEAALSEIERVERLLSTWDRESDLSRLNRGTPGTAVALPRAVASWLVEAEAWAMETGRAFDPTVGPLIDAWGLRSEIRVPPVDEVVTALERTGPRAFSLSEGSAERRIPGAWIDAGGFGKGAALRAVRDASDADVALVVDLGGQFWVSERAEGATVVVAHPEDRTRPVATLRISGVSVATSGTSERPHHVLDPRTGRLAPAWGSVTVVHDDPFVADALATALYVMGPEAGLAWARLRPAVGALFLEVAVDGDLQARWTPAMERWLDRASDGIAEDLNPLRPSGTEQFE